MSARSQTQSVNGGSGNGNGGSVRGSIKFAGEEAKDRMYEPKHKKKVVRVLTVVAYVFSVSLAAIMLSMYYIFIWQGTKPTQHHHHAAPTECRHAGSGMGGHVQDMSGGLPAMYNESNIAETPRALPARDLPPVALTSPTPLSRLALQYLQLHSQTDNFSDPSGNS